MSVPTLTPPVPPQPRPPARPHWGPGRILATIAASLFLVVGIGLVVSAGAVRLADSVMRDDSGFLMSGTTSWYSPGYAVRSDRIGMQGGMMNVDMPHRLLGDVRVTAEPTGANGVFVGIGPSAEVARYLRGVARTPYGGRFVDGGSPPVAPTDASFWSASASGADAQTITWEPRTGSWTLVVMNSEGTTPVAADVRVGAQMPFLGTLAAGLLVGGLLVIGSAGLGLWFAVRTPRTEVAR